MGMGAVMICRGQGSGLIFAGLIVTLIGSAIVVAQTFDIPRYWTTFGVGIALPAAGALRAALGGRRRPGTGGA
jgi:hypothetical protein